ncbi:MAG: CBS domain-containing protein [Bdellovibrionales bacterium]|nr:CBS domain-containing protein [Bdellovibrionales bacterium]
MNSSVAEMVIGDVMTRLPHSVGAEQTAHVARERMKEHNVRHLPVQKGGELVGIVSDRDLNFALAVDLKRDTDLRIEEIYTPEPTTVGPHTKLVNVLKKMDGDQIGCVLVVEKEQLVGIYTTTDACRDFHELLAEGTVSKRNS